MKTYTTRDLRLPYFIHKCIRRDVIKIAKRDNLCWTEYNNMLIQTVTDYLNKKYAN